MLSKIIDIFKEQYNISGDAMILDRYIPADGTYVLVKAYDESFVVDEIIEIKMDKKTRSVDRLCSKNFDYICFVDYYSRVLDINKAILTPKGKIIQSNNYLSFIIKKESIENGKLEKSIIDQHYEILKNPRQKYKNDANSLKLYEYAEKTLGSVDTDKVDKIHQWINDNLFEKFGQYEGKDYLKIYFYYPGEDYIKESQRYSMPTIYNSNKYNVTVDDKIYGLPNNNMGLNSKKPYLENMSRKNTMPYLVDQEEAKFQQRLFDYLITMYKTGKCNMYFGEDGIDFTKNGEILDRKFSGFFINMGIRNKKFTIVDFDTIDSYSPNLNKTFEYKNILGIDAELLKMPYENISTRKNMQQLINEVFFSKYLILNYFTEAKDIPVKDKVVLEAMLLSRDALFKWFFKGANGKNAWQTLQKPTISIMKNSIISGYIIKSRDQFNLIMSLKEYFEGGESMADIILGVKDELRNKISNKTTGAIDSDKEYFFAVGQIVNFFLSRSKGKNKPLSLANPFINANRDEVIKNKLTSLYKKYNYDIESYNYRFKNMYCMIMGYEVEGKIDTNMIISGYLHSNLIYEKNDKIEAEDDNEINEEGTGNE